MNKGLSKSHLGFQAGEEGSLAVIWAIYGNESANPTVPRTAENPQLLVIIYPKPSAERLCQATECKATRGSNPYEQTLGAPAQVLSEWSTRYYGRLREGRGCFLEPSPSFPVFPVTPGLI